MKRTHPSKSRTKAKARPPRGTSSKRSRKAPVSYAARARPAPQFDTDIPRWWLNTVVGIFLLIPAALLTQTLFTAFRRAARQEFWFTEEFWFFSLGAVLWVVWFFGSRWACGEPRPIRAYVFGHELTHAIWVWLMGGRVSRLEVSRDGGYIITDTHNFWIALAPYFYPLYTLVVIILYGVASLFYNVTFSQETLLWVTPIQWVFTAIGATWSFHFTFTCWMIPRGQSDLSYHGTFFSLVVIYIMNLAIIALFVIVASPEIYFSTFGRDLLSNTEDFSEAAWNGLTSLFRSGNRQ